MGETVRNAMVDRFIQLVLVALLIFTPIAFGAMEIWAFTLMELGILLMIMLWAVQRVVQGPELVRHELRKLKFEILLLSLFLTVVIFQMIPLPAGVAKVLSPRTYELRQLLSLPHSSSGIHDYRCTISFVPFLTKVEFYKWLTLAGLFLFLLRWRNLTSGFRTVDQLVTVIFLVGVFESLFGIFEFFRGHSATPHLVEASSVRGTFINRNYFAGYLLMVIPLSMGFFFYREARSSRWFPGWRHRLSSVEGKTLLIGFGTIVMILGLIFSASRMGILSLLLSFTLIALLFRPLGGGKGISKTSLLIIGLALLWALWIGVDAIITRFFVVSEDLKGRWMIWHDSLRIVRDFPAFGSGLGTFSQILPMYKTFHMRKFVSHAENDFLQLASEVGVVGAGTLLALLILLFLQAVSNLRSMPLADARRYLGTGALVGIVSLMLHSLVERNLQVPANAFLFTFLWALLLRVDSLRTGESLEEEK